MFARHTIVKIVFEVLIFTAALAGGIVAAVAGFGIGSLLTPAVALQVDARLAVAVVSIPHMAGTAFRFWLLGGRIDRRVLWNFGVMSAAGGLVGALLQARAGVPALTVIFGALLLFSAAAEMSGLAQRMRFDGPLAWVAGGASGLLGGLVGNQGGIRSAALLGVDLPKHAFVATATAVALMVDAARVPVYLWQQHDAITERSGWIVLATLGVIAGTLVGNRVLAWIPERSFRRVVAIVLAVLGTVMVVNGFTA
ncbi:MAG TPA: sulfite exporter TauE/SafE family protein [Candidatus Limnocylindrales bacterium]|nr:sulfite exporter TauE/SafE family protein [Candidatus Limnocylindrales bacterium]